MGNHRWLERRLRAASAWDHRVLELGAGDGLFGTQLVNRAIVPAGGLSAIDLCARPTTWPDAANWQQGDVLQATWPAAEIVVANLFLHHFQPQQLAELGRRIPGTCRVLLCSEPTRARIHLWQARLLSLLPLSRVTRHDMPVSIRAGFRGRELPEFLALSDWKVSVSTTFFGAYRLEAHRH